MAEIRFNQKTILWKVLVVFMMSVFIFGCSSPKEKKAEHQRRAEAYLKKGKLKDAVIELRNVVQLDPKDDSAYYELGETYLRLKKGREAFQSFSRAVSANPENLKAQLKLGQIYLLARKTKEARKKADLLLAKSKDNIDALSLLAGVQVQEKDIGSAIKTLQKITTIAPNHFNTYLSLGRLFFIKRNLEQSEKAYQKAILLEPNSKVPYVELANVFSLEGQGKKAEAELRKMLSVSETKYLDLPILGRFYEHERKWKEAQKAYVQAVKLAPGDAAVVPLMNLGAFYARRKDYPHALETFEKAAAIKKDNLDIQIAIAQLDFDFKKMDAAQVVVDRILVKDKGNLAANFLKGRLNLVKKDYEGAVERFDLLVGEWPRNAMVHYFRGLALLAQGKELMAERDLVKSVELDPRLINARVILAERYLRERHKNLAREQINAVLKDSPGNVKGLMLKGNLEILDRDAKGAEATFKQVIRENPDYAPAYVRLGLLFQLTHRLGEARKHLVKALEINPKQGDALALLVGIQVRQKKFDEALKTCRDQKDKMGNDPPGLALAESLMGNIYLAKGNDTSAERHFKNAVKIDPNILGPYVSLARIYLRNNRWREAVSEYENILKKNPKMLPAYMALGTIYDQRGDSEKAEGYYRKALDVKSDFAPAANNLAWDLAMRKGNMDEALGYAQTAKEQMPNNPAIGDTLGWIFYLRGNYLNAIAQFQDSLQRDPDNPVINYHLGMALFKNKQFEQAKERLEEALKLSKTFEGSAEANRALEEIKKARRAS